MTDLPSLLIGAALVVVGNVVIASLNHWYQSSREKSAHERKRENDEQTHVWALQDARTERLRAEYAKVLLAALTFKNFASNQSIGVTREIAEQRRPLIEKALQAVSDELPRCRVALALEGDDNTAIFSLLDGITHKARSFIFGVYDNYRVSQLPRGLDTPGFEREEFERYVEEINIAFEKLEKLLSDRLAISPMSNHQSVKGGTREWWRKLTKRSDTP